MYWRNQPVSPRFVSSVLGEKKIAIALNLSLILGRLHVVHQFH